MISIWTAIMLTFCAIIVAINTSGYAFAPEKFPLNKLDLLGWAFFALTVIIWEIAKK